MLGSNGARGESQGGFEGTRSSYLEISWVNAPATSFVLSFTILFLSFFQAKKDVTTMCFSKQSFTGNVLLPERRFEEGSIPLEVLVERLRRGEERYDLPVMLDIS